MAPPHAWYGEPALKQAVLTHLDADHEAGTLSALRVGAHPPARDWSPSPADLDALRAGLGIPVNVLAFGLATGGLSEDPPFVPAERSPCGS